MDNPTGRTRHRILEMRAKSVSDIASAVATLTTGQTAYITSSGTGPFTVNVQVIDQNGDPLTGYYWVRISIGTTAYEDDASGSVAYNIESCHWDYSDGLIDVLTNSSGVCEIEITASADRYVTASVLGSAQATTLTYGAAIPAARATRLTGMGVPGAYF